MPNPHDRTGLIQYVQVPIAPSTTDIAQGTFHCTDQCHIESATYTAGTAATGATALSIGVADGGSTIVSAVSIDGSIEVSLTVATQLVTAGSPLVIETDTAATTAGFGGAVTFKLKWDDRSQLQEGQ